MGGAESMNDVDFHLRFNFHESRVEADAGRQGEADAPLEAGLPEVHPQGLPDRVSGERLFRSIIQGDVESLYRDCLRSVRPMAGKPRITGRLRLIIHLDPGDAVFDDYALIRSQPWEWLFDPVENRTLGLHREFSIVRQLKTASNSTRRLPQEAVNVLLLDFSPADLEGLDTESEADELEAIFAETPGVHCERLSTPTIDGLRMTLLEREIHILHFAGHGDAGVIYLSEPRREAQLLGDFQASNPENARFSHAVDGELLASCLGDQTSLLLVVLNACKTGVMLPGHGVQPLAGVAPELMAVGVPMVIAPRVDIFDEDASAFSKRFFRQLWREEAVDTAVVEGRQAVRNVGQGDWASFSVFMRHTEYVGAFSGTPSWGSESDEKAGRKLDSSSPLVPDNQKLTNWVLQLEEDVLRGKREVREFTGLLDRRFNLSNRGYDDVEDACSALTLMAIARPGWSETSSIEEFRVGKRLLKGIFDSLEDLVGRQDFVLFSSVQKVLASFLQAHDKSCLDLLDGWLFRSRPLHQLFALNSLPKLAATRPDLFYRQLIDIAKDERFRETFWLGRAFLMPIRRLHIEASQRGASKSLTESEVERYEVGLLNAVTDIVQDARILPEVRSLALASLPSLATRRRLPRVEESIRRLAQDDRLRWGFIDLLTSWSQLVPKEKYNHWHFGFMLWLVTSCPSVEPIMQHVRRATSKVAQLAELGMFGGLQKVEVDQKIEVPSVSSDKPAVAFYPNFVAVSSPEHFECRERVQFVYDWLSYLDESPFHWLGDPRAVDLSDLRRVHYDATDIWPESEDSNLRDSQDKPKPKQWKGYVDHVRASWDEMRETGKPSKLPVRVDMYEAALLSAGAVLDCVDYVYEGGRCAWALNRPPGHLANNAICLFNNVAVGAAYARERYGYRRIVIVDFDAHCGMHTSRFCSHESNVMYVSLHESTEYGDEFYQSLEPGASPTLYIPYDKESMGDYGYALLVENALLPVLDAYSPDLILLSAGFDGHQEDPLNPGYLTDEAFRHLAQKLTDYASGQDVPIVGTLEGGYGLRAMARCFSRFVLITGGCSEIPEQRIQDGPPHLRIPEELQCESTKKVNLESQSPESVEKRQKTEIEHAQEVIKSLDLQRFLDVLAEGSEP